MLFGNWPLCSNYCAVSLDISPIRNGILPMGNVDDVLSSGLEQTFYGKKPRQTNKFPIFAKLWWNFFNTFKCLPMSSDTFVMKIGLNDKWGEVMACCTKIFFKRINLTSNIVTYYFLLRILTWISFISFQHKERIMYSDFFIVKETFLRVSNDWT